MKLDAVKLGIAFGIIYALLFFLYALLAAPIYNRLVG